MDLPRAEVRYHGHRAVVVGAIRAWFGLGSWLRPRIAPLAITALATLCMLAGLDLIARDLRRLRHVPEPSPPPIYLMRMKQPAQVIPVELAPAPADPLGAAATSGEVIPVSLYSCSGPPK